MDVYHACHCMELMGSPLMNFLSEQHTTADEEDQLMSLDASGKPVVVARPASAKPGSSMPSKIKTSSSTSHSVPGSKPKGSASGNRSTAGSQRPGSAKPSKGRLAPLSIPSGLKQHKACWFVLVVCLLSGTLFLINSKRSNSSGSCMQYLHCA